MRTIVCGRWNKHSSAHCEARELWSARNRYDAGLIGFPELRMAQDALTVKFIRELDQSGVDFLGDGSFRWDSVYDIARLIGGCNGFKQLTRIPNTNHFHRQWRADLPLSYKEHLLGFDLSFAQKHTSRPLVMSLAGPYTLARQTANVKEVGLSNLALAFAGVLNQEIRNLLEAGAAFVRIEEPQILAHSDDWQLFLEVAERLTQGLDQSRVILATWYHDICAFPEYFRLPFGVFWLDFVDTRSIWNLRVLDDFPKDKQLVAGIFDATETCEEDIGALNALLVEIVKNVSCERLFLGANTDLHFLPYDQALRKVQRLIAIAKDFSQAQHTNISVPSLDEPDILACCPTGKPIVYIPDPNITRALFGETKYPTSTVGSFPQPQELRRARIRLRKGELDQAIYGDLVRKHTRAWMDLQDELDITLPVSGEFSREDMAAFYGKHFGGQLLDFVPSYENRRYRPVEYFKEVQSNPGATVPDFQFVQSLTPRSVKETITGPATLADWALICKPSYYRGPSGFRRDLAQALRREIDALIDAGVRVLQIDEPALTTKMGNFFMDLGAIGDTIRGLETKVYLILHICYSDMEALDRAFPHMLKLSFHQIHIEMANRDYAPLRLIEKYGFGGKDIGLGVLDVHTDRVETVDEIVAGVERVRKFFRPDQIWLTPDCGLKERSDEVARAKLRVMCEAAKVCRQTLA